MNAWIQLLGIDFVKPFLTAMLLPPVPWLALIVWGGVRLARQRRLGWTLLLLGVVLEWASATEAAADAASGWLLNPPPVLADVRALTAPPPRAGQSVIVVLGGGRTEAAEYPAVTLNPISMERLRYAIWLSRQTGLPLAFSGGRAPGSRDGPSEAEIATRIAREEFRHPLRWAEGRSRDTRENALRTVEMLRPEGVGRLVLVTHDLHMPRALGHFERARDGSGLAFELVPAPVGSTRQFPEWALSDYYPTPHGAARMRYTLREWLGLLAGA